MSAPRARGLLLALLALLAAPAALARPAGEADAKRAVRTFREARTGGLLPQTLSTLSDLAAHDDPLTVAALVEALDGPPALRPTARRVLAGFTAPKSVAACLAAVDEHRSPEVRAQVLLALAEGRPGGVDWSARAAALLADRSDAVRAAAVSALGQLRVTEALPAVTALAADPSERVRQQVPEALARLAPRRVMPLLSVLAQDARWRVRLGVVRAATLVRGEPAAALLVDMLERDAGRLREDVLDALFALTRRDYGLKIAAWRRLLETTGESDWTGAGAAARSPTASARYHGVGTTSQRFLLVTDLSGSMASPASSRYRLLDESRLRYTQDELRRLLGELSDGVAFDLVTFNDGVRRWKGRLVPMDGRTRRAALAEVDTWRGDGGTNIFGALEVGFDLAAASLAGGEEGPDTIFLLSDGEPSSGPIRNPDLLLEHVAERNRELHLRIHCVSLTSEPVARDFLDRLAARTGGRSVNPLE